MRADQRKFLRVLDANYNRAKEGLRVCEDVCRFVLDDRAGASSFKRIRHDVTAAVIKFGFEELLASRDIGGDVGKATLPLESKRNETRDIFYANAQRIKESLRVLEEFSKLLAPATALNLKKLRYRVYALEQKTFKRL